MLYTKIRHAERIRKLSILREPATYKQHGEIGSRMGLKKYSRYYYELIRKLQNEGVLDERGVFISDITNQWLAELPIVLSGEEIKILGNKVTFMVYLDLFLSSDKKNPREIHDELKLPRSSTYYAIEKLASQNIIKRVNSGISISTKHKFHGWLTKYVESCLAHADITNEISILFDTAPAQMDGPHAFYNVNYEPGRPMGSSEMIIKTNKPFIGFWKHVIDRVRYFTSHHKKITVLPVETKDEIVWVEKIPYNKNAKEVIQ